MTEVTSFQIKNGHIFKALTPTIVNYAPIPNTDFLYT